MDEDGDWVTIQDSSDLQFAIQVCCVSKMCYNKMALVCPAKK